MQELKYFYKIENNKLIKGSGYKIPDSFVEYNINNKPSDLLNIELIETKNKVISDIESFADAKTDEAEAYVADKTNVTINQRKRYESKYTLAKKYLSSLDTIAEEDLLQIGKQIGLTDAHEVADLLIKLHNDWVIALDKFNLLIDYFRIGFTKDVIDNFTLENKELFNYKFKLLKELTLEATYSDIDAIISITELPEEDLDNA